MKPKIDHNAKEMQRLAWSCRRGMLELDVILTNFLQEEYGRLNSDQKQAFIELLQYPDPELFACFLGTQLPSEPLHADIVIMVREHARKRVSN